MLPRKGLPTIAAWLGWAEDAKTGREAYAARAQSEVRGSSETARRRVPEAWSQLTPQELQIAQLAAEGLPNREIGERLYLSRRTIGTRLHRLVPEGGRRIPRPVA